MPVCLDLPGPSRRIRVEPLRPPVPAQLPAQEPEPAWVAEPEPEREPAPAAA